VLEVDGVGPIAMPVSVRQAKELCLVARPARFHSMLVYAPGQFFAPHQDSRRPTP
jgi:hypothetical protein